MGTGKQYDEEFKKKAIKLGANLLCELYCLLSLNCVDKSH